MADDTNPRATGFRSLVEQIQPKDAAAVPERQAQRRTPSRRQPSASEAAPAESGPSSASIRLLERRWL